MSKRSPLDEDDHYYAMESRPQKFTSSLEICVSLSVDDGDQKLPAVRPAVLSTDDDHNDNGSLNEINGMSEYELKRM